MEKNAEREGAGEELISQGGVMAAKKRERKGLGINWSTNEKVGGKRQKKVTDRKGWPGSRWTGGWVF